jgi:hypothetical protein
LEEEEEESDGGRATPERWNPPPPSTWAEEAAVELVPAVGVEASAARSLVDVPAGAMEVPQPSRKRKWGFSNLR